MSALNHEGEAVGTCPMCGGTLVLDQESLADRTNGAVCVRCWARVSIGDTSIEISGTNSNEVLEVSRSLLGTMAGKKLSSQPFAGSIFISYRRGSTSAISGRLFDRLQARFGKARVFMDVDSIPRGVSFILHIKSVLKNASLVLAVIGEGWQRGTDGQEMKDNADDFVRLELETAIACGVRILPVLVDTAEMPHREDLPDSLTGLPALNAAPLASGRDFNLHLERIMLDIEALMESCE